MKLTPQRLFLFAMMPILMAMSPFQDQQPGTIPVPDKKFTATFIDQTDILTKCRDVSIDGKTVVEGTRGNGTNSIPFENIRDVVFRKEGENLKGIITFHDGNVFELELNKSQRAYGYTTYGTYRIRLSDLKKMTIHQSPVKQ